MCWEVGGLIACCPVWGSVEIFAWPSYAAVEPSEPSEWPLAVSDGQTHLCETFMLVFIQYTNENTSNDWVWVANL